MIHFFKKEETVAALLIILILFLSYSPLLYHLKASPAGKVFSFSTGYPPDFLANLAVVQEGYLGDLVTTSKNSSTIPSPPIFNKMECILIGHLARIFKLRPEIFFHLARFFLSLSLLLTSYYLLFFVFKKSWQRLTGFILILFSTQIDLNFLPLIKHELLINYWTPLHFNQRFSYYPHYLFSFLFLLWAILFLARALKEKKRKFLVLAVFFGFLSSFVHPPPMLLLYLCLPFYLALKFLSQKKKKSSLFNWSWIIFCVFIFAAVSSLPLFYLKTTVQTPLLARVLQVEKQFSLPLSPLEIILGIGPTFFLSLLGLKKVLQSDNDLLLLLLPTPLVLLLGFFYITKILGLANARFLQSPFFIFLGILSVLGIQSLKKHAGKKFVIFFSLLTIFFSTTGLNFALKMKTYAFRDSPFVYIDQEVMSAIDWLEENTDQKEIVLSSYETGTLIIAYSGNRVFASTFVLLTDRAEIQPELISFFKQNFSAEEATAFLKKRKISYVLFGPEEEKLTGEQDLSYPFLKLIFENKKVKIYGF